MPIRIYALAKQLDLDSKVLVDICTKAGITGKGSALASLSDEELAKVTAFMSAGKAKKSGAATATLAKEGAARGSQPIRREDYIAPGGGLAGKVRVLTDTPKKKEPVPPKPQEPTESVQPPAPLEPLEPSGPLEPLKPPAPLEPLKPPGPLAPLKPSKPPEKMVPAIKLAPMPTAKQPPEVTKSTEPAPQKPDIKLPADAIHASKAGTKPVSAHLRKHEQKKKVAAAKKTKSGFCS